MVCGKLQFTERVIKKDTDPDAIYDPRIKRIRSVKKVRYRVTLFMLHLIISGCIMNKN